MFPPHFRESKWVVDGFSTYVAGSSQPRGRLYDSRYKYYQLRRCELARHAP